jgi:translation initiation factor 1
MKKRTGPPGKGGIVYSTELGRMCPACGQPLTYCVCRQARAPVGDGNVRVGRETKGRKGKGVTVIAGVPLGQAELQALATHLKRRCGSGGTLKDGVIEIQGDHRDLVVEELQKRGWSVKRSGG